MRLSYGLIGDLADCFPQSQLKQLLLANWIGAELRARHRMLEDTKKTMRWAREVSGCGFLIKDFTNFPTPRW
jgi:importin subunit beta-1